MYNKLQSIGVTRVIALLLLTPAILIAFALPSERAHAQSTADLQQIINDLLAQVAALQAQLGAIQNGDSQDSDNDEEEEGGDTDVIDSTPGQCLAITNSLYVGASDRTTNGEVSKLQQFLRETGDYTYPRITGYYGPSTQAAVQRWQARNGVVSYGTPRSTGYGLVGAKTRAALRAGCDTPRPPAAQLSVDLRVEGSDGPISLERGDRARLTWKTVGAVSCTAAGSGSDWGGRVSTNGSKWVRMNGKDDKEWTFNINCSDARGNEANDTVTVYNTDDESADSLVLQNSSDDPDASTLLLDEDDSVEHTIFAFDLSAEESQNEITLEEIEVTLRMNRGSLSTYVNDATLEIGGWSFEAEPFGTDDNDTVITFDIDSRLIISDGRKTTAYLSVEFENIDSPLVDPTTIYALVNPNDIKAEGADDVSVSGSRVTGETHTLAVDGTLDFDLIDTDTESQFREYNSGIYTIEFELTALGEDIYVPAGGSGESLEGIGFFVAAENGEYKGGNLSADLDSTADTDGSSYHIPEGETEMFTLTVEYTPLETGMYRMFIHTIHYGTNESGTGSELVFDDTDVDTRFLSLYGSRGEEQPCESDGSCPQPEETMSLEVTSPNGGEELTLGETYEITWDASSDLDKIYIGWSTGPGSLNWIPGATNIANTGSFDWDVNVGNFSGDTRDVKIKITAYDTGVGSTQDESDGYFTVVRPNEDPEIEANRIGRDATTNDYETYQTASFGVEFEVTALTEDVYIPITAERNTVSGTRGFNYAIIDEDGNATRAGSADASIGGTADIDGGYFHIQEGETEEFLLGVQYTPEETGSYKMLIKDIWFNDTESQPDYITDTQNELVTSYTFVREPSGGSYSQGSYYSQSSYAPAYTQGDYYTQGSYYSQGSYGGGFYSQSSYYRQASYYSQGTYYSQSSYSSGGDGSGGGVLGASTSVVLETLGELTEQLRQLASALESR